MDYKVNINSNGYIEIKACDILSVQTAVNIGYQIIQLATKLEKNKQPAKLLLNSTCIKSWSHDSFKMVEIIFKNLELVKVATYGGNKKVMETHRKIISNAHKEDMAKVFNTREEAERWLSD